MKKITTLTVLLLFTVLTFGQDIKYVDTETLNIRENAGKQYNVIGQVNQGEKVTTISESNGWTEIETENGTKGFVASKYLSSDNQSKSKSSSNSKKESSWISILIGLGILGYAIYKVKNFFSGLFGGSSTSSRPVSRTTSSSYSSSSTKNTTQKTVSLIADTRVKSNNYIETFDENGKRINGMFLGSNERFVGFSQSCFITVKSNNYLTTYNAQCKRINGMFLGSNEHFHGCAGNTFTTRKDNNYVTTYDTNCKRVSGRFA